MEHQRRYCCKPCDPQGWKNSWGSQKWQSQDGAKKESFLSPSLVNPLSFVFILLFPSLLHRQVECVLGIDGLLLGSHGSSAPPPPPPHAYDWLGAHGWLMCLLEPSLLQPWTFCQMQPKKKQGWFVRHLLKENTWSEPHYFSSSQVQTWQLQAENCRLWMKMVRNEKGGRGRP